MRDKFISALAGVAFSFAASGFAFAADMPVKAPPSPPPAPVYNWTGWYVGGNVGYGWGNAGTDIAGSGTIITTTVDPGSVVNPVTFADSATQRLQGVIGGGQIGYNYQFSPRWMLGFETDIQASGERASNTFTAPFSGTLCFLVLVPGQCEMPEPLNGLAVTSSEAKIDWFGTVRGRIGYLLNDGLLLYGTGGLAYGRVRVSGSLNVSAVSVASMQAFTFGPTTSTFDQSKTNIGFAVGGGLEGRLAPWLPPSWTWKLEYLYVDLGSLDTSTSFAASAPANGPAFSPLVGTMTTHTHFTDNIVRVGVNYHFGGPVVAAY